MNYYDNWLFKQCAVIFILLLSWSSILKAEEINTLKINGEKDAHMLTEIGKHVNIENLNINCLEHLKKIPDEIGNLKKLKVLEIDNGNGCSMNPEYPETLGLLSELETLVLYGALDGKPRSSLPKSLANLKKLETLNIGRNQYEAIPDVVFEIPNLKTLDLTYNKIKDLPNSLLKLKHLSKVILDGNYDITCSPSKMAELVRRFKNVRFDFSNEFNCSDNEPL